MCSGWGVALWFCGIVGAVALVCGAVLLPLGLAQQAEASDVDPSEDFASAGTCKIRTVNHRAEAYTEGSPEKNEGPKCMDIYSYQFVYQGDTYMSREERIKRGSGRCDSTQRVAGSFSVDEETPCWRSNGDVSHLYRCQNDPCMKIFDPAEEIKDAQNTAQAYTIAGAVLLPVSVLFLAVAVVAFRKGGCKCK